jgi:hypothetical protein
MARRESFRLALQVSATLPASYCFNALKTRAMNKKKITKAAQARIEAEIL